MENNANKNAQPEGVIDVSQIVAIIRRNWWMFALSLFACLFLAGVYLYVKHDVYSIHAKVLVAEDEGGSGGISSELMSSLSLGGLGGGNVEDEVIVLGSHSIKAGMIKELKLNRTYSSPDGLLKKKYYYNNSPIEIDAPEELFDTLSAGLKFNIEVNDDLSHVEVTVKKGRFKTVAEAEATSLPMVINTPYGIFSIDTTHFYVPGKDLEVNANVAGNMALAEAYAQDITVEKTEKKANGISLFGEDINIKRGKDILNKMIELYNRRGQAEKNEVAINTANFIEDRLDTLYNALSVSENKIQDYKQSNDIVDVGSEAQYLMSRKGSVESALLEAQTSYEVLKMTNDFFNDPVNNYSLMPFSSDLKGASVSMIGAYNDLIMRRTELEQNAQGDNASLQMLNDRIDALRENIKKSLSREIATADVRIAELKKQDKESKGRLNAIPAQERAYLELLRDQKIKSGLYTFLLQKREENQLVLAATTPKGKIVDAAFAFTEPIAPKKKVVLLVAFFFGLVIPAIWLYIKPLLSNKIESVDDLSSLTKIPQLGEICHSKNAKDDPIVVSESTTRPIAELFRLLRTNLQFMLPAKDRGQVVMVTSGNSGEGKTFISMNIAESLALLNKKVVLVGMDIRLPMLAQNLGLPTSPGVTNFLSENISIDQIIKHRNNCDVVVAGPVPPNPSELLLTERVEILIAELKSRYDYVVIDSAPIALVSDTLSLSRFTDAVVYVARANYTQRRFIKYLNHVVDRGQLKNVSIVMNDTNPKFSHGYGYGYGYGEKKQ